MSDKNLTPMLAQYHRIKNDYQDALVLYRLGDFYEMFYEDAYKGAKDLNIALTKKKVGKDKYIPMCGIPYHAADSYISRLVAKGHKVAICEQLEDASKAKGIVKRDVIRVITPGTFFENEKMKSALSSVFPAGKDYGVSYLDLSTGEFFASVMDEENLISFIGKFQPKEILIPENRKFSFIKENFKNTFLTYLPEDYFDEESIKELLSFFNTVHESSFGFTEKEKSALHASAAILKYSRITQKSFLPFIATPRPYRGDIYIRLDYSAQKHLELVSANEGNIPLLRVIDRTLTGMGRRRLKFFILHPLKDVQLIKKRQEAVEELYQNSTVREKIREILNEIFDVERLISKISSGTMSPRDMVALKHSLKEIQNLKKLETSINSDFLKDLFSKIEDFHWLADKMEKTLEDNPPVHLKEGGLIKKGVDPILDELKEIKEKGNEWIKEYQEQQREKTGIQSLKVGFNKVMGYYIEITKPNLKFVPEHYRRRQTLSNAERFTTEELQRFEEKILSADEKIKALEYEIFMKLREEVAFISDRIAKTAQQVGILDAIQSLSTIAVEKGWVKPEISDNYSIEIKEGVHPVIAETVPDFVPNDLKMDEKSFFHIITGPNMAGKSTYIRQSAIIILLAQTGSFIPAKKGKIGVVDGIFTRIGSGDILSKGLSTFMVEMLEVSNILNNITGRSFIVLDEVGRGTSTYDGLSIAWAISEYISKKIRAKTLFATHYHELTKLEEEIRGVKNFHMHIYEDGENIKFLYKVMEGFSNKSYGVHVAKLAGIKEEIIKRAYEILYHLEEEQEKKIDETIINISQKKEDYLPLFKELQEEPAEKEYIQIIREIENIDLASMTPIEAMVFLNEIKNRIKKSSEY
ncbi:DNA mismatch repair protein MutS [Persephonella hydrogeniphila]|uniref:DNA mismatch repair protein MutS n=1 Tax=Persephonella hydrogeniphila TaxID=198703 RepID=A0A285NHE4_9AQUI|nr:DNA mismatch repair protein MutS [Persephonella hydrogeniphila]SNZ08932.1 DNA mismatch repair protein MutS [Persephonella hydrogeniphila]